MSFCDKKTKIVDNFPNSRAVISVTTFENKTVLPDTIQYFKNILIYLDEHIYFNYLKATNPDFGLSYSSNVHHYIRFNVEVSAANILYYRAFPEDREINNFILEIIRIMLQDGSNISLEQIREIKNNLH
tara:strand:- start:222 stop:608 length:387 start_codon:yes stop_codon:yes gene_type:complete